MPPNKRVAQNFVTFNVYKGALNGFYFLYDHSQKLKLMEDGALVHYISLLLQWRQAHGMAKLIWLANF